MRALLTISVSTALLFAVGCGSKSGPATTGGTVTKPAEPPATSKPTPVAKVKPTEAPSYAIKIERAMPVGFRYRFTSTGSRQLTILANGKPSPAPGNMTWSYEAEVTVTAVSARGRAIAESHKIVKLSVTAKGKTRDLLSAGQVVKATVSGTKESFAVAGKPVAKDVAESLRDIVSLDTGKVSDDDVFGSKTKRKLGESWEVDRAALVKSFMRDMKGAPMPLKAENVAGKITLVRAETISGIPALSFKVEIRMSDVAPKMGPVKPTSGSIDLDMDAWLPTDTSSLAGRGDTKKMTMHVEGSAGPSKLVIDMVQQATEKKIAIK